VSVALCNGEVMAAITTPLDLFTSTCEALEVPAGAARLDAFLRLPDWQQEAILVELLADAGHVVTGGDDGRDP